jgi:hypothetical protein
VQLPPPVITRTFRYIQHSEKFSPTSAMQVSRDAMRALGLSMAGSARQLENAVERCSQCRAPTARANGSPGGGMWRPLTEAPFVELPRMDSICRVTSPRSS